MLKSTLLNYLSGLTNKTVPLSIVRIISFKMMFVFQQWQIQEKQATAHRAGSLSEHNHRILLFVIKTHQNIITNLLWAKVKPTVLGSPWKLRGSAHVLWVLYGVLCSSQCVWLRLIRCMAVCTMGIQPCVAGALAGWRQYSSQMQTPVWFGFVQNLQKFLFYSRQKTKNQNQKPEIWSSIHNKSYK